MRVDRAGDSTDGFLGDGSEDGVAELLEKGCAYTGGAIYMDVRSGKRGLERGSVNGRDCGLTSYYHAAGYRPGCAAHGQEVHVHTVND